VRILEKAQSQIRLQAYGFTSSPILTALVAAKQRGVDVGVILDKSDERASSASGADYVARAGIPVFIDYQPAIAHNKVIVVDRHTVITGSYNFTAAAERMLRSSPHRKPRVVSFQTGNHGGLFPDSLLTLIGD
jgi:phosphatidylserine/phosphatidylglycerophosphate/cardiolipin synthase-like enzyme